MVSPLQFNRVPATEARARTINYGDLISSKRDP